MSYRISFARETTGCLSFNNQDDLRRAIQQLTAGHNYTEVGGWLLEEHSWLEWTPYIGEEEYTTEDEQ